MGIVVPFRRDGRITRRRPPRGAPLEIGCDWDHCNCPGVAWRWCARADMWIVVCARCIAASTQLDPEVAAAIDRGNESLNDL